MRDLLPHLLPTRFEALSREQPDSLQVNLGYRCNQRCLHCHVAAGPHRRESMDEATRSLVVQVLEQGGFRTLDLTGGAPELHPGFRALVVAARALGVRVIDRCNLTVLLEPGQEGLARFLADQGVDVVASLPCYLEENLDRQRGKGVFARSIEGLRLLNGEGYGMPGTGLCLDLVYNPQGASLPPSQPLLEADYKQQLRERHGIHFNRLLTLANLPAGRFGNLLLARGELDGYLDLLKANHCPANRKQVMCRRLVSVDWQGYLYDCDFNQVLGLPIGWGEKGSSQGVPGRDAQPPRPHLSHLLERDLSGNPIRVGEHCYGCTAGQGSSCGGALGAG
ncbi:MAG: radical SAM protein [Gammaproteobacteria bacterium RIFOXYD12_FULL_61_37]|nr:MAG: radical SAM protein [Gammaproteobacteria bacterium RIFOXYD12_FULL_61_37]